MARPRSDIDRRIVRAARARFLADGVDGASLRAIARAARTNVGMITYYFPAKDDLFLAVVEEVYAALLRDFEAILAGEAAFGERVRRISLRVGALTDHELEVVRLVVREALVSSSRFRRLRARFQRGHIPLAVAALAQGVERGELDGSLPMPVLLGCMLGISGAPQILRRILAPELPFELPSAEETARIAAQVLLHGAGVKATPAKPKPAAKRKR
jgi:AcrR family transcriptional regulator